MPFQPEAKVRSSAFRRFVAKRFVSVPSFNLYCRCGQQSFACRASLRLNRIILVERAVPARFQNVLTRRDGAFQTVDKGGFRSF